MYRVAAALDVILGNTAVLSWLGISCAVLELLLVAIAASYVIRENSISSGQSTAS
jgi:hypothetical protein